MNARTEPLFGRERELREIDAALAEAVTGRRRLLLISGEPGIGKTRLAQAAADRAEATGALVLWGRCWEGGGAPAFWPWVQLLRGLVGARDREQIQAEVGSGAPWIAQLVPELRSRLPEAEPPPRLDSDQARFALFDAVGSFLSAAAVTQPLVLVLDDLHASDQASVLLLEFLARSVRNAPLLLLATYQEVAVGRRPELRRPLGAMAREGREIALRGVDEAGVAQMLAERSGRPPSPELVRELHATTEGNPFFAEEVIRLLVAEGRLDPGEGESVSGGLPLPDTVRETVARRFEPLGAAGTAILEAAAVIGREFRFAVLAAAAGADRERVIEALDEAERMGLVAEVPGGVGGFRFGHGLLQQSLYSELGAARRIHFHRAVGEAIERTSGAVPENLAELAHHFAEAAPGGEAAKALEYARRAADHAMALTGYEQAAELLELALGASDLLGADHERRAELMVALGDARLRGGDPRARETLLDAGQAAREAGRADLLARAALCMRPYALLAAHLDEVHVGLLEEALERLDSKDSPLRARLLARLAVCLYYLPQAAGRRASLVEEAVQMARRIGDSATVAHVLSNAQLATWGPDTTERDLSWTEEMIRLARELGDTELALSARNRQVDFLLELDDLAGADIGIEALERMVVENREPRARAWVPLQRARRAMMEGRFADAERLSSEAAAAAARLGESMISMLATAQIFMAHWSQGRLGEVDEMTRRFADSYPELPTWRAALIRTYCEEGRDAEARRELERLAHDDFAGVPRYNGWLLTLALAIEACAHLGDTDRAARLYEMLVPFAGRNVLSPFSVFAGPVSRYLGIAAATCGDVDRALEHFAAARAGAARAGARPTMLQLCLDEVRALVARAAPGDRDRALDLLSEATELGEELGTDRLLERVEELRDALTEGRPREEAGPAPDRLSVLARLRREGDVWAFEYEQRTVRVRDSRGVRHLATLLENPGVEIHSVELATARPEGAGPARRPAANGLETRVGPDTGVPALDAAAKEAYGRRAEELRDELEEAEAFHDPERATRARAELDFLSQELAAAVGLGGRDRSAGSSAERARVNVTRAIRSTVKRISDHDERLGRELDATVRTGTFCCYEPDVRHPVTWRVETG